MNRADSLLAGDFATLSDLVAAHAAERPDHPAVMIYSRGPGREPEDLERLRALGIDAFRVAQELLAGNARGFWVVDPCHNDGTSCETGDECCGGYCRPGTGGALPRCRWPRRTTAPTGSRSARRWRA